ncbi:MAG: serine hydrolase [Gemmatimonadaceae bacterium]|nr:serine hydrolase [Gemmatimonadaceae bacterium]
MSAAGAAGRWWRLAIIAPLVLYASMLSAQGVRAAAAPARIAPVARADTAALRRTLDSLSNAHHGVVGYTVANLETGEHLSRNGDEPFPTASLIKVPIAVALMDQVATGQLSLDDRVTVLRIEKVPGAGVLQFLHDGAEITIRDAAWLMLTLSDNTATNLLLSRVEMRRVWDAMENRGLPRTKVHSKVFLRLASVAMDSSVKYGLGVSTPNEMARLFTLLADGKAVTPAADSVIMDMLEHNEDAQLLQRFNDGVRAPHKTGATDAVRTECTVFHLQSRVVTCVFTRENQDQRWVLDSEPQRTMAEMGRAVMAAWPKAVATR